MVVRAEVTRSMIVILYASAALIAIAFLILVIFVSKTLKSLQATLDHVSKTLGGLENQLESVTRETTSLLHKTNHLADDMQRKAESFNSVVDAVKDVGVTVSHFNQTLKNINHVVEKQVEDNKEKIAQVVQWSSVILEIKDKWKDRKQKKALEADKDNAIGRRQKERGR